MTITRFKIIQGHHSWYQTKARKRLPIGDYYLHPILHRFRDNADY